jgi:hypothetical protein
MFSPWHDLFRYHPAYRFGRPGDLPCDRDRSKSAFDEFEELERRKPRFDEYEEEWRQSYWTPPSFAGDLAAALLILLALWGVASLFHDGFPQQQAGRQPEQMATETASPE